MNHSCLNCPSPGGAMSAEEFAAALGGRESEDRGCTCRTVCCCHPEPPCPPAPTDEGCCCKNAFLSALRLLCNPEIAELLDFSATAFFTRDYVAGATVAETVGTTAPADNLVDPLTGVFRRFSPCSRDLLDINAVLNAAPATATGLTATQINLCELVAVTIQLAATVAEGDLTPEQVAARNLRLVRRALARCLTGCAPCGSTPCCCPTGEDCCCAAGLLNALADNNVSRQVSLAAGPLLLSGVTLVGSMGDVLVLVNETDQRFYFVCVNHVQFLA